MKRIQCLILLTALAGACFLTAVGCSTNPVTSETVTPSDQTQNQSVVSSYEYEYDTGGYPATSTTTIDKYDSDQGVQSVGPPP
jgi:hypothetical protein